MTKKQKTKPQLLAEALGTTSEEAKLFGDQVNQCLLRSGHQVASFIKMCEVIRSNPDLRENPRAVAEALQNRSTPRPDMGGTGLLPKASSERRVQGNGRISPTASVRLHLNDIDETDVAQATVKLLARLQETGNAVVQQGPRVTAPKLAQAHTPKPSPDEAKIRQFVEDRGIQHLVHLTTMENLRGICREQAILSVTQLKRRNLVFQAFDTSRLDGHLDFINCSIGYHNFHMFYAAVAKNNSHDVILLVRPDYLWLPETRFCPYNAATGGGRYVGSGYEALVGMYQECVEDKVGPHTRANKPEWLPTNIQAEVLVYQRIPIEHIMQVVVRYPGGKGDVASAGWTGKVIVDPASFMYRDTWISKTPRPPSTIDLLLDL